MGVGLATRSCARPRLLPPGARAGRGPSMQTPGAGFAAAPQPWGLQTSEVEFAPRAPSLLTRTLGADPTADVCSNRPWV